MITKINFSDNKTQPVFRSRNGAGFVVLRENAYKQAASLQIACKEIFSKVKQNNSLIQGAKSKLGNLKLSEKSVTFNLTDSDAIRLAMPRGVDGNLFTMQVLRDKKPINTVTVNELYQLIASYSLNNETLLSQRQYNKELVDKTVDTVFNLADSPLLKLRIYIKNNSSSILSDKLNTAVPSKIEPKEESAESYGVKSSQDSFLPPSKDWQDYSFSEIIKQNAGKYTPKRQRQYSVLPSEKTFIERIPRAKNEIIREIVKKDSTVIEDSKIDEIVEQALSETRRMPSKVVEANTVTEPVKKRRGRPPKIKDTRVEINRPINIVKPKEKEKTEKVKKSSEVAYIDNEFKTKIEKIKTLYRDIKAFLAAKTSETARRITNSYKPLRKNGKASFDFYDLKIVLPQNKQLLEDDIIALLDSEPSKVYGITGDGKIVKNKMNWGKLTCIPNIKFWSKDDIDTKFDKESFDKLLDRVLERLNNFKYYLDNNGWYTHTKRITKEEPALIQEALMQKLNTLKGYFERIHQKHSEIGYTRLPSVRKNYEDLMYLRSGTRFEFINPEGDGLNILFDYSTNRYGEIYKIAKHSGQKNVEEMYAITSDGKVVKNLVRNLGIGKYLPTNTSIELTYYSDEELKNTNILNRIEYLAKILETKFSDYENYLIEDQNKFIELKPTRKRGRKPKISQKNVEEKSISEKNSGAQASKFAGKHIDYNIVKEFLEKTASDIQAVADKLREATGFKSILDSVSENLKTKFDDFLAQFKK